MYTADTVVIPMANPYQMLYLNKRISGAPELLRLHVDPRPRNARRYPVSGADARGGKESRRHD